MYERQEETARNRNFIEALAIGVHRRSSAVELLSCLGFIVADMAEEREPPMNADERR